MFDFFKLDISFLNISDLKHQRIFQSLINEKTGEIEYPSTAEDGPFEITIKGPNYIEIRGSIHQYANWLDNGKSNNYDDFSFERLVKTILTFCKEFNIDPYQAKMKNLEYGVNIIVDSIPKFLLESCCIGENGITYSKIDDYNGDGFCMIWKHGQYLYKLYDKFMQFGLDKYVLRFEKKVIKMQFLQKFGIKYLSDLMDLEKSMMLKDDLVASFNTFKFVDSKELKSDFSHKEQVIFLQGTNPEHWKIFKGDTTKRKRFKKKFQDLKTKHNLDQVQNTLQYAVKQKANELVGCYDFTDPEIIKPKSNIIVPDFSKPIDLQF